MNQRRHAFEKGLRSIRATKKSRSICAIRPNLYNASGMAEPNQIIQGDCIKILNESAQAPNGQWVDLVFADPPFNIGYLYHGYNDERNAEDYQDFSRDWMTAVFNVLKPTGSFYLAIGDDYAAELCVIAKKIGFHLRNWIVWHYTFGQQTKMMFAKSHTHILYFTKTPDPHGFTFNADAIRVASARQTTYGDSRANPKGKAAGRCVVPPPAGDARSVFRRRRRYVERQPGVRDVQGARRLARLPDADQRAQSHHQSQQQSRRRGARPLQRQRHDGRRGGHARPTNTSASTNPPNTSIMRASDWPMRWRKPIAAALFDSTRESKVQTAT